MTEIIAAKDLSQANARHGWSLHASELAAMAAYFQRRRREPTRAEAETVAQTWSEHCKHKTFTSPIRFRGPGGARVYKNLLAETVMAATKRLNKPWCLSVFEDNAGVVEFNRKWALAYKVETHNHPCALEPYGGAQTGVGGVIRDVLGVGLGAKPVLNTDVFCLAAPDHSQPIPQDVLHPRRVLNGVVAGVRDYGNRMGIPTAAGAVWFDEGYLYNPLVFVGTVGLMPAGAVRKKIMPGDAVVAVGGRTGRDGIHGATFSSASLSRESDSSAVQIGHAIAQKRLVDGLLRARDRGLYRGLTDCGAGGFSSAVGEMAALCGKRGGAKIDASKALLKTTDLEPWEIWLSESQERMVLAVPPKNLKALCALMAEEGVEACVLGEFTDTGRLEVFHAGEPLVDLDLDFLHEGLPRRERAAVWEAPKAESGTHGRSGGKPARCEVSACGETLHWMLSHPNVCSREWIIRQYDHEVQAGTVIKPLQGLKHDGPGDACVIWPCAVTGNAADFRGFAVAHGLNPELGKLDPYRMALACVDEAIGNLACVGADVTRAALLDNFCWGSPEDPALLGALVRAAEGCRDAALGFQAPFISGKDSFNNEYRDAKGRRHPIPGALLISALAPVPDIRRAMTLDFKAPGDPVYLIGRTGTETGGSLWALRQGFGGTAPAVDAKAAREAYARISQAARKGLLLSAHNLSEGGLAVAAAEMAFSGEVGVQLDLEAIPQGREALEEPALLFTESPSRLLVETTPALEREFLKLMKGTALCRVGTTLANPVLRVMGLDGRIVLEEGLHLLKQSWQKTLPRMLLVHAPGRNGNGAG